MEYEILRSDRKEMRLKSRKGKVIVLATPDTTEEEILLSIRIHRDEIEKKIAHWQEREKERESIHRLTKEELAELKQRTGELIAERVKVWAPIVGVEYGNITIGVYRTKWGHCKSNGDLAFNCLLALVPPMVCDSVVVHELCHRLVRGHSKYFYGKVLSFFPEYRKYNDWLKENGWRLIAMISPTAEEKAVRKNVKRLEKIKKLEQRIEALEKECAEHPPICLVGVKAALPPYGEGTVVRQDFNKITVRFGDTEKSYILDEKFTTHPRFENDEKIIAAFTDLAQKREQIESLERERAKLEA